MLVWGTADRDQHVSLSVLSFFALPSLFISYFNTVPPTSFTIYAFNALCSMEGFPGRGGQKQLGRPMEALLLFIVEECVLVLHLSRFLFSGIWGLSPPLLQDTMGILCAALFPLSGGVFELQRAEDANYKIGMAAASGTIGVCSFFHVGLVFFFLDSLCST